MARRTKLDFDDGPANESPPDQPAETPPPQAAPAEESPTPAKGAVICQRCNVACVPVGPAARRWVKCPKCGWKHKTFEPLIEARRAQRAKQSRAAR